MLALEPVLAVDIGGTKMAAALVDEHGSVRERRQTPTPAGRDPEVTFAALAGLWEGWPLDRLAGCGIGCGGPMSAGGTDVSPLHIPSWRRFPLRQRVAAATGLRTWVDNDAKAVALGEGWIGAATGEGCFIGMVVSTGVGGGIVLDGRLLDGRTGNAGHIGHMVVAPDGRPCSCGGRGCLEAEASGTAIAQITGRPAAEAAPHIVARSGTLVGRAVASVANLLDLSLAVVGGSVALGFGTPFFSAAQAEVDRLARLDFSAGTRIVPPRLGDRAPLVGAAAVAYRALRGAAPDN